MKHLDYALQYRAKGWSVIPIQKGSKLPAIKTWTKYQTELPTEAEIKTWFSIWPDAGIALVCGKVSGVIAVDIDKKSGGNETAKSISLPPTLVSNTGGGGNHYLYKWREGLVPPKVGMYPGIDIRSDKSYIVLPPTLHASGNTYEWANEDDDLADAPPWLEESGQDRKEKESTDWDKLFKSQTGEGLRNMTATKMAGKILYEISPEMWDTLGYPLFKQWNSEFNVPSLPKDELETVWKSIKTKHTKNNPSPDKETKDLEEKFEDNQITPADEENLTPEEEEKLLVKLFLKNKTSGTFQIARYIVNKYNIITVGEKEREMFVYQNGMYHAFAENLIIYPEIQRILKHHVNKNAKSETFHKIADMTAYDRSVFASADTKYIPLKNGVFNFETKELLPHSPDYRFKYQLPITYDSEATCPKTEAFFEQILSPEQKSTVEEWIGYYFLRDYMFKKAMVYVGEGDTGKTTLLEVIIYLLGRENISAISLQRMTSDKFSAAHLYEKHGNLVDELSARDISDTDAFKMATGNGSVTGEYKFGNQFSFQNFSKLTYACNRIPDMADNNDVAYFNRWIVIRFENTIKKKIPNFVKTLTTETERSGLFNLAIKGLQRLLTQEGFTYANNAEQTKMEMMRSGSSIAMFASDSLERSDGAEISKEDMYEIYVKYCQDRNLSTQTKDALGKRLGNYAVFLSEGNIDGINGKGRPSQVRGWRNVKVKGMKEKETEEDKAFAEF